jgi:hypothetical protein
VLSFRTKTGVLDLKLNKQASKWERAIRSPKTRIEKLGVKPASRVLLFGMTDSDLTIELESRGSAVLERVGHSPVDVIFLQIDTLADLTRLPLYKGKIAAHRAGLVDVKVVAFSATHSAEKLVIPVANRPNS